MSLLYSKISFQFPRFTSVLGTLGCHNKLHGARCSASSVVDTRRSLVRRISVFRRRYFSACRTDINQRWIMVGQSYCRLYSYSCHFICVRSFLPCIVFIYTLNRQNIRTGTLSMRQPTRPPFV